MRTISPSTFSWLAGAALALLSTACSCPPGAELDEVFLLDGTTGPLLSSGDGGGGPDATSSSDAGGSPDSPAPVTDCTPAAAGCVPGRACDAACRCVLRRDQRGGIAGATIEKCTLLDGPGAPSVEVRYTITPPCGCSPFTSCDV